MDVPSEVEEYVCNANEALSINLVRGFDNSEPVFEEPFHPAFTYPIFGDEEAIFGYKGLEVQLSFRAYDLMPKLDINYDEKYKPIGDTKAMDVRAMLQDFLPEDVLEQSTASANAVADPVSWKPPGKLISSYRHGGKQFEIFWASLCDPRARELLRRVQVLIPLFIEGGTCQNLDDQPWTIARWKLFLLYEVAQQSPSPEASPYHLVGFSTSYRLWVFPTPEILSLTNSSLQPLTVPAPDQVTDIGQDDLATAGAAITALNPFNPLESPSRERISQFIILPPYQGQSHGSHLYNAMVDLFLSDRYVFEFAIEDPSEAFDDLRDLCDLIRLRRDPEFANLEIASSISPEAAAGLHIPVEAILSQDKVKALRHKYKIHSRQFGRLIEMQTYSKIPARHRSIARITRKDKASDENDRRYYFWRLYAKHRLYIHNMDQLMQVDLEERRERLAQVVAAVEEGYVRLLEGLEKREAKAKSEEAAQNGQSARARKKRRRFIEDDDDDDEEKDNLVAVDGEALNGTPLAKRPKIRR